MLSDGDCNEGSTWEAVLFAAHQKLSSLTVVVDLNCIQGIGHTKDILNLGADRGQVASVRLRGCYRRQR